MTQLKPPILWELSEDGYSIQNNDFENDVVLRISGDFERNEDRMSYAQWIVNLLNGNQK